MSVCVSFELLCNIWVMNVMWGRVTKPSAGISLLLSKSPRGRQVLCPPSKQNIKPSHHRHWGGIWNLIQVYLEQKLAFDVLLHHPSSFQSQGEIKNSYPAWDRSQDRCVRGSDSTSTSQGRTGFLLFHHFINGIG